MTPRSPRRDILFGEGLAGEGTGLEDATVVEDCGVRCVVWSGQDDEHDH
jgi:hypothetical protein